MKSGEARSASARRLVWWSVVLLVAVVLIAAVLVAGELMLRYRERHRDTTPGTMSTLFYQHTRLRHAMVRDFDYFGWLHVNRNGFRGREVEVTAPPGVFRIMAVGSSTTFDPQASGDSRAWPALLEEWLNKEQPGVRFEVINAGVPGYTVLDNLIRLQVDLHRFRPDLLVFYEGHNDLFGALRRGGAREPAAFEKRPDQVNPETPWGRWLSQNSLLYGKVALRFAFAGLRRSARRDVTAAPPPPPEEVVRAGVERFERDLWSFLALARRFQIPVVLPGLLHVSGAVETEANPAVRQMWSNAVPFAPPDVVLRGYRSYDEATRRAAAQFDASYLPTESFGVVGRDLYAGDDPIHFNDRGSETMARAMARALVAAGLTRR